MRCVDLFLVLILNSLIIMTQSILAPVLPLEVLRRDIDQLVTGLILGFFSAGWITIPFLLPKLYPRCGRRALAHYGVLLTIGAVLIYAFAYFIPDSAKFLFSLISCTARLVEGIGASMSMTATASLVTLIHSEEVDRIQAVRVLGITSGVVAGIALGAIFFKLLGYFWLYTCFAILLVVPLILLRLFPERKEVEASRRGEGVGWWDVLSTR